MPVSRSSRPSKPAGRGHRAAGRLSCRLCLPCRRLIPCHFYFPRLIPDRLGSLTSLRSQRSTRPTNTIGTRETWRGKFGERQTSSIGWACRLGNACSLRANVGPYDRLRYSWQGALAELERFRPAPGAACRRGVGIARGHPHFAACPGVCDPATSACNRPFLGGGSPLAGRRCWPRVTQPSDFTKN